MLIKNQFNICSKNVIFNITKTKTMKTSIKLYMATILLLVMSCSKQSLTDPQSLKSNENENTRSARATHYVGESYGGGIVFFVDSLGQHGLISDLADLGAYTWRPNNIITITGANKSGLGKGKMNTQKIIQSQDIINGDYAALACTYSTNGGFSDWFLPSKDELNKLYIKRRLIGGFNGTHYWTSTEAKGNEADYAAWIQYFPDGSQDLNYKYNALSVRAIRSF